jgi:hypothetical protein
MCVRAIARQAARRRVALEGQPSVGRAGGTASAALRIRGDRVRWQSQVGDAFAAAEAGLRENPATPAETDIQVALDPASRGDKPRRFRSSGQPVALYLDGKLGLPALWSTYIREQSHDKNAVALSFADDAGGGHAEAPDDGPNDDEAIALLARNFAPLGACARAEGAKNPRFSGVTIVLRWTPTGAAESLGPKEPALKGGALARCLQGALAGIHLPRFRGAARTIEYPIRVKTNR